MASTMNIPGYYYDPVRKKYFKIEKSQTAPGGAAWSVDSVKRRRLDDEEQARSLRRADAARGRVARARVLSHALTGGFLDRELAGPRTRDSLWAAGFVAGLAPAGKVPLKDARWVPAHRNVDHLFIDNQDVNTDMCVAFATTNEQTVISTYVPRDESGRVHRRLLANYRTPPSGVGAYHELAVPQVSDIKYHQQSNQVLIASRHPGQDVVIWAFAPKETMADDDDDGEEPRWRLGWSGNSVYRRINTQGDLKHYDYQANTIAPAPPNSSQVCAIGTNRGVVRWVAAGYRAWLTPQKFTLRERNPYTDVFAVDYLDHHPEILLFGGRPGRMWISDHRLPIGRWDALATPSPITHIRSVNEYQVLVAGLRNQLAVYDLRFRKGNGHHYGNTRCDSNFRNTRPYHENRPEAGSGACANVSDNADLPLLTFPEYKNEAHFDVGLDYDAGTGIAAAAHDDGRVALYSVRGGRRLACAEVDGVRSDRGPVRSIRLRAFPRDHVPSLFFGLQSNINVYSFGGIRDVLLGGDEM